MLDLAGGNAFFFVLDLHDEILLRPGAFALVAIAVVASTVLAVAAAAAAAQEPPEEGRTFGQAKLLAGVSVNALIDFLGFRGRNADPVVWATALAAATVLAAGFHCHRPIRRYSAGLAPYAKYHSAQSEGE